MDEQTSQVLALRKYPLGQELRQEELGLKCRVRGLGLGRQDRQALAVMLHLWQGEEQNPLTVTPELRAPTTPELYVYCRAKLEEGPVAKLSSTFERTTASPEIESPGASRVKLVPEREQERLPLEQEVLERGRMSEGRAILREVREGFRAESRAKGAVIVRVTLEGSERAIWSSLLVVAARVVGVKESEETGVCSVAKLFEL